MLLHVSNFLISADFGLAEASGHLPIDFQDRFVQTRGVRHIDREKDEAVRRGVAATRYISW